MHLDGMLLKSVLPNVELINFNDSEDISFSVDSRSVLSNEVFIALKGAKVDGHDYLSEALKNGAGGLMLKHSEKERLSGIDPELLKSKLLIIVEDTFDALIHLAASWRKKFSCPIVAITGSVGKTSTKQIVGNICLRANQKVFISKGNQNTLLGVSLNILRMRNVEAAVFEVGINKRGEMAQIAKLLNPTIGVITNVGHSHMEGLGTLVDISSEKRDIFKSFQESSIGIINGDSVYLSGIGYSHPVLKFGSKTINQIQARKIKIGINGIDFILKIYTEKFNVHLDTFHEGLVYNSLAAASVAHVLKISAKTIVEGISEQLKITGRFEKKNISGGRGILIDDCYNANPESVKSALVAFNRISTSFKKVIILSDMNELGEDSPFWHRQIGRFLRKIDSSSYVILMGKMVQWVAKTVPFGIKVDCVSDYQETLDLLEPLMETQKLCILVKGSTFAYTSGLVKLVKALTEGAAAMPTKNIEKRIQV